MKRSLFILLVFLAAPALAEDRRLTIESRPGVWTSFYYQKQGNAKATVLLLPGGKGIVRSRWGRPDSNDFLVRSRDHFFERGFNVVIVENPSDTEELHFMFRSSAQHLEDIKSVAEYVRKDTNLPVWLIGTSRGTISAAAAAAAFGNGLLDGIVLTSTITSSSIREAVPRQDLDDIRIPVLVVHHRRDACDICDPDDAQLVIDGLTRSPAKRLVFVDGGEEPSGRKCGSRHWHGFVGIERTVVELITEWIERPAS